MYNSVFECVPIINNASSSQANSRAQLLNERVDYNPTTISQDDNVDVITIDLDEETTTVLQHNDINFDEDIDVENAAVRVQGYEDLEDCTRKCNFCGALFWFAERLEKNYKASKPTYNKCCMKGKVELAPMLPPPGVLDNFLRGSHEKARHYRENIRAYNSMLCFTSMGGKVVREVNRGRAPPVFKIHGQNYHTIGSMLPAEGEAPKFCQLCIYDTQNEVNNRLKIIGQTSNVKTIHAEIVAD